MKYEDILTALEQISDKHIKEAEKSPKKKKREFFKMVVAATLVFAIATNIMNAPMRITAHAVALASEPRIMDRPDLDDYKEREEWKADLAAWTAEKDLRIATTTQATSNFSKTSSSKVTIP